MTQVEALHVALQQSFSPVAGVRDPAEAMIKRLKFVPGATQMLLHITAEKQVSVCVRERECFGDFAPFPRVVIISFLLLRMPICIDKIFRRRKGPV